jgi:hypothetical protein
MIWYNATAIGVVWLAPYPLLRNEAAVVYDSASHSSARGAKPILLSDGSRINLGRAGKVEVRFSPTTTSCNSGLHTHKWIRRMRSKDRAHRLRRLTVASRFTRIPKTVNCEGSGESD